MKHLEISRRLLIAQTPEELADGSVDTPDRPSFSQEAQEILKKEPVGVSSVLLSLTSMFTYTTDIATSMVACYWLYYTGRWWWYITIVPLLSSLIVVNGFSMRWYIHDAQEAKDYLPPVSTGHWFLRIMFHVFLIGPIVRFFELFLSGLHALDKKDPHMTKYRLMFLQEDRDVSLLAMVGSFIKSGPLLVLQMYILTQTTVTINFHTARSQAINLVSSLLELSVSQSSYRRALRRATPLKRDMTKSGAAVHSFSHFCLITSRVLAIAAFASVFRHWVFVFCAAHWVLMTAWLALQRTAVCATSTGQPRLAEELLFNLVLGGIYLFCFVNVKEEPTRWKYTFYFFVVWIENVTLSTLYYFHTDIWYRVPLLSGIMASLAASMMLLVLYYKVFHPNKVWERIQRQKLDSEFS